MIHKPYPGQRVRLSPTSDPTGQESPLEGAVGQVHAVYEWGAIVRTDVAASGEYRAGPEEMFPFEGVNGHTRSATARDLGYTGDVCPKCGSSKMRRNGSCQLCEDCGDTTGCS